VEQATPGWPPVRRLQEPYWARHDELEEYTGLSQARILHRVEVREPFVLVSQVQRSGGSLMTFLFDGHPECHVFLGDLDLGHPDKGTWPLIDLDDDPDTWFDVLYETSNHRELWRRLYALKKGTPTNELVIEAGEHPRIFLPRVQKAIFDFCIASRPVARVRDVLDAYMTSHFNAWLDNQNLYSGPKKVVVGFGPTMHMNPEGLERFFAAYPDGTLITSIRDPRSWYASAKRKNKELYGELEKALRNWRRSAEASLEARERYGDRVVLLTFDQVVMETEQTMARIADRLGITMSTVLVTPTANGQPRRASSSYPVERLGILPERTRAYRDVLPSETIARIEEIAGDFYANASALIQRQ
jgi:Sulfotransferase family